MIRTIPFIILLLCLHCSALCDGVQVLGNGTKLKSPNSLYVCWIDYSNSDWNILKVQVDQNNVLDVWRCVRALGVSWSPDSRYLAVEDYLDKRSSAVLVFRVDAIKKTAYLIYQTPYSNSVFDIYEIEGWFRNRGGDCIGISRTRKATGKVESERVFDLDHMNHVAQTIYPDTNYEFSGTNSTGSSEK